MPRKSREPPEAKLKSPKTGKPSVAMKASKVPAPGKSNPRQGAPETTIAKVGKNKPVDRSIRK